MDIHINIPTTWNDLSETQLKNIVFQIECYHFEIRENADAELEIRTRLFIACAKELLRGNSYKNIKAALTEILPTQYGGYTTFLFEKNTRTIFTEKIKIKGIPFYGPDVRLRNITIGELSFADSLFYNWRTSHNTTYLNALCATLYRTTDANSTEIDKRKPFNKLLVDKTILDFSKVNYKTKLAIAYTYEGCRNHLMETYKNVFPKREHQQKTLSNKYVPFGEIIIDKIKGDPSKLKETQNLMATEFLSIYDKDIRDIK
tara:strand:+ start:10978 stop:11754 length:777 start_codon:yes stop_codon:yes gene_type:complete